MKVKTSLGFSVKVGEDGRFHLPDREFTASELKKIAREVNRHIRESTAENDIDEVFSDE